MKTIIAGSREGFTIADVREAYIYSGFEITEVVSGGARGVDRLGEQFAKEMNIPIKQFIPDWDGPLKKAAGHKRNRDMGDYADALIVLIYNNSSGSTGMLQYAKKKGLKVYEVRKDDE